jgi:hypothetical protein
MPEVYSSSLQSFKHILKYEGLFGFYKGMAAPLFAQFFVGATSFAANSLAMAILEPNLRKGELGSPRNTFISGMRQL